MIGSSSSSYVMTRMTGSVSRSSSVSGSINVMIISFGHVVSVTCISNLPVGHTKPVYTVPLIFIITSSHGKPVHTICIFSPVVVVLVCVGSGCVSSYTGHVQLTLAMPPILSMIYPPTIPPLNDSVSAKL